MSGRISADISEDLQVKISDGNLFIEDHPNVIGMDRQSIVLDLLEAEALKQFLNKNL